MPLKMLSILYPGSKLSQLLGDGRSHVVGSRAGTLELPEIQSDHLEGSDGSEP